MKIHGKISQIHSGEKAYLNLMDLPLGVGAWTVAHKAPTYLVKTGSIAYFLVQFDSEDAADEWLENTKASNESTEVTRLDTPTPRSS